jgi:hypothetical protein
MLAQGKKLHEENTCPSLQKQLTRLTSNLFDMIHHKSHDIKLCQQAIVSSSVQVLI